LSEAAIHVFVRGAVQGVGFRHFVRRTGRNLGLSGWVRNLSDGRVEVHAEGQSEHLQQFLERLRQGPSSAAVSSVESLDIAPAGLKGFEIRY
jgi:acylphosphatase